MTTWDSLLNPADATLSSSRVQIEIGSAGFHLHPAYDRAPDAGWRYGLLVTTLSPVDWGVHHMDVRSGIADDRSQDWFWTSEWQAGETEASAEAERGDGEIFESGDDFLASLSARGR